MISLSNSLFLSESSHELLELPRTIASKVSSFKSATIRKMEEEGFRLVLVSEEEGFHPSGDMLIFLYPFIAEEEGGLPELRSFISSMDDALETDSDFYEDADSGYSGCYWMLSPEQYVFFRQYMGGRTKKYL